MLDPVQAHFDFKPRQFFLIPMSKQLVLITFAISLGTVLVWVFNILRNYEVPGNYYDGRYLIGSIWAFMIFRTFKRLTGSYKILAAVVSFNEVLLFQAKYLNDGSEQIFLCVINIVLQFTIFMSPLLLYFRSFKSHFELR